MMKYEDTYDRPPIMTRYCDNIYGGETSSD